MTAPTPTPQLLTQAHYHAFGHIVTAYAKVEQGFKFMIARLIGARREVVQILCEPYSSFQLRDVLLSFIPLYELPGGVAERITELIKEFDTFRSLRNAIAHDIWNEGARPGSIKPLRLDIRSGNVKIKGMYEEEKDWTLPELEAEALKLKTLHAALVKLLNELCRGPGGRGLVA